MKLIEYIKQFFSSEEYDNEEIHNLHEESQDCESYYVPPAEDVFHDKDAFEDKKTLDEDLPSWEAVVIENNKNANAEGVENSLSEANPDSIETVFQVTEGEKLIQLQDNVISSIEEFDSYLNRIENDDAKELVSLFQHRLIESLTESGLARIDSDTSFNCIRHIPVPFHIIPDGTYIQEIKRAGLLRDGQIVLKAIVTTKSS